MSSPVVGQLTFPRKARPVRCSCIKAWRDGVRLGLGCMTGANKLTRGVRLTRENIHDAGVSRHKRGQPEPIGSDLSRNGCLGWLILLQLCRLILLRLYMLELNLYRPGEIEVALGD